MKVINQSPDQILWREDNEINLTSVHVTSSGCIGIEVDGHVILMDPKKWHALGRLRLILKELEE